MANAARTRSTASSLSTETTLTATISNIRGVDIVVTDFASLSVTLTNVSKVTSAIISSEFTQQFLGGLAISSSATLAVKSQLFASRYLGTGRPRSIPGGGGQDGSLDYQFIDQYISTAVKKFGTASLGSGSLNSARNVSPSTSSPKPQYIIPKANESWVFQEWLYRTGSVISDTNLLIFGFPGNFIQLRYLQSTNLIRLFTNKTSSTQDDSSASLGTNAWVHLAVVYVNGTISVYLDGARVITRSLSTSNNWTGYSQNRAPAITAPARMYVDDVSFNVGTDLGYDPTQTTITVPTTVTVNDFDTTRFLYHFDHVAGTSNAGLDDTSVAQSASANLTAAATQSVAANANTKQVSAALTSTASVAALTTLIKSADCALTSTTTTVTDNTTLRLATSDLSSLADLQSIIGNIKQFVISAGSLFEPSVTAQAQLAGLALLESQILITADAVKSVDITADIHSESTISATGTVIAGLASNLTTDSQLTVTATRTQQSAVTLVSECTFSVIIVKIGNLVVDITSEFTQSVAADKLKNATATMSSLAEIAISAVKTTDTSSSLTSDTAQTTDSIRIRFADTAVASVAAVSTQAVKTTDVISAQSAITEITANAVKSVSVLAAVGALFSPAVDADITVRPLVFLETAATLSAIIGSVKQLVPNDISGARSTNVYRPVIAIQNPQFQNFGPRTPGFCASIWMKLDEIADNQCIWRDSLQISNVGVALVIDRLDDFMGTSHRIALRFAFDPDEPMPIWPGAPTDTDWHHYLLWAPDYTATTGPAYAAGNWFRFWLDGQELNPINNNHQAGSGRSFSNIVRLGQAVVPNVDNPHFFTGYTTQGAYAQLWMGGLTSRQFNPLSFYDDGYVDLGSQGRGTFTELTVPYVYNVMDQPFDANVSFIGTPSSSEQISTEPLIIDSAQARFHVSATANAVSLFVTQMPVISTMSVSIGYQIADAEITATATSGQTTAITQFTGIIATITAETTMTSAVSMIRDVDIDVTATGALSAVIGFTDTLSADLTATSELIASVDVKPPIRAEAALSVSATFTADVSSFTDTITIMAAFGELTADVTVIPPIRIEADLTVETTLTAIIGSIEQFAILTVSSGTMQINAVKTTGAVIAATSETTQSTETFKFTGIVANFAAINITVTVGEVINIDPYLQIKIPAETRGLRILEETRVIHIESETRVNIIKD